jgi:hypothetical protein
MRSAAQQYAEGGKCTRCVKAEAANHEQLGDTAPVIGVCCGS